VERELLDKLRQRGYKLTPQRRAVLKTFARSWHHLTPAEIYEKVKREYPGIGLVTVYRTLEILAGLGLICELHAGGSCRSYTTAAAGHHHHLICAQCGEVIDFSGYDISPLEKRLRQETGFEIEGHLLEFVGRCRSCQRAA